MIGSILLNRLKKIKPNKINSKAKTLKKFVSYSSHIDNDNIQQKSIKMISNGKKTNVLLFSRDNDKINRKSMQFNNNKRNLANILKINPVAKDLNDRLYNDFFKSNNVKVKSSNSKSKNNRKSKSESDTKKKKKRKTNAKSKTKSRK
jgi:hypothetical protein